MSLTETLSWKGIALLSLQSCSKACENWELQAPEPKHQNRTEVKAKFIYQREKESGGTLYYYYIFVAYDSVRPKVLKFSPLVNHSQAEAVSVISWLCCWLRALKVFSKSNSQIKISAVGAFCGALLLDSVLPFVGKLLKIWQLWD